MSDLRIRVELNKGRIGIPLSKLANIADETAKFLALLSQDVDLGGDPRSWLALNFRNESVDFDLWKFDVEDEIRKHRAVAAMRFVMSGATGVPPVGVSVRTATLLQYSRIAGPIDADERIGFGLLDTDSLIPEESYSLTKLGAEKIAKAVRRFAKYFGQTQGRVHALYKESDEPKIVLRDFIYGHLVDCFFGPELYGEVVKSLQDHDGTVIAEGIVTENLELGLVESIRADSITAAPRFDIGFYQRFLGSRPNLTGKLTTEKYIRKFRSNG